MKTMFAVGLAVQLSMAVLTPSAVAAVTWSGAAGDNSWNTPRNWSGNQLPGSGDDVVVPDHQVTIFVNSAVSVRMLSMAEGSRLYVQGNGVTFIASGRTTIDGVSLDVHGGAILSLPGMAQYSALNITNAFVSWTCDGTNSVLEAPGLTSFAGSPNPWRTIIQASSGGRVTMGGEFSILSGALWLQAQNTNSVIEAPGLRKLAPNYLYVDVHYGGRVSLPNLLEYDGSNANAGSIYWNCSDAGSVLEIVGLTNFVGCPSSWSTSMAVVGGGRMTLDGDFSILSGGVSFSVGGTNSLFTASGLRRLGPNYFVINVQDGAQVSLSGLREWLGGQADRDDANWISTGSGSRLELPGLTNFTGSPYPWTTRVRAENGGRVILGGQFGIASGGVSWLSQGTNSVLEATGLRRLAPNYASITVSDGGRLSLPDLREWDGTDIDRDNASWSSDGAGSLLEAAGLTNFAGSPYPRRTEVVASHGGRVRLAGQFGILSGGVRWSAEDTNSVLEAPGLWRLAPNYSEMRAYGGGRLSLTNLLDYNGTNPDRDALYWTSSGGGSLLEVAGLTNFAGFSNSWAATQVTVTDGGRMVLGGKLSLLQGGVAFNISGTNSVFEAPGLQQLAPDYHQLIVRAGAHVSLPGLREWVGAESVREDAYWVATGPGSVLELPGLTNLVGGAYPRLTQVIADNGGRVVLGGEFAILSGRISLQANSNSVLEAPGLRRLAPNYTSILARDGGRVSLPDLREWRGDNTDRQGGANWASAGTSYDGIGSVLEIAGLTNFSGCPFPFVTQVTASQGGRVTLAGDFSILSGGVEMAAQGVNTQGTNQSLFEAPGLRRLAANYCNIHVEDGGRLSLTNLLEYRGANPDRGTMYWSSSGSGSVLEVAGLTNFAGTPAPWETQVSAWSGGRIKLAGNFSMLNGGVSLRANGTNSQGTNSLLEAPGLRRLALESINITVEAGAQVSLPDLQDYWGGAHRDSIYWDSSGAGSLLDVPGLNSFVGSPYPWTSHVGASGGGRVRLGGAFDFVSGCVEFYAQDPGSRFEAPALGRLAPLYIGLSATDGGRVSLPGLREYSGANTRLDTVYWTSSGADSVIDMPGLTSFIAPQYPVGINIGASDKGQINLGSLPVINSGIVRIVADGAGSSIDLHSLSRFETLPGDGSLRAPNGGAIALAPIFTLKGPQMETIGAWGPPAVSADSSPNELLCANLGLSVQVEVRPTGNPDGTWQRLGRIAVTTNQVSLRPFFYAYGDIELRARELLADPPELELHLLPDGTVRLTVFGLTAASYRIDASPSFAPRAVWSKANEVKLTHPFEQLDIIPSANLQMYRAMRE